MTGDFAEPSASKSRFDDTLELFLLRFVVLADLASDAVQPPCGDCTSPRRFECFDGFYGLRNDLGFNRLRRRVLEYRVARLELRGRETSRIPSTIGLLETRDPRPIMLAIAFGILILWLNGTFRNDDVDLERVGDFVVMIFEASFCLGIGEGEAELIKVAFGKSKLFESSFPDPSPAVVRSQFQVFDHHHRGFRLRVYDLAVGHENAEVRDGSLGPLLEPFGNQGLVAGIAVIVLAVWPNRTRRPSCTQSRRARLQSSGRQPAPLRHRPEARWER